MKKFFFKKKATKKSGYYQSSFSASNSGYHRFFSFRKRIVLKLYAYRYLLVIFTLFLLGALGVSLWLGLDFYRLRTGPQEYDSTPIQTILDDNSGESVENKARTIVEDMAASLGPNPTEGNDQDNPIFLGNGSTVFFGSSACPACSQFVNVPYRYWNRVQSNPTTYPYFRNLGPLNSYAGDVNNSIANTPVPTDYTETSGALQKYWLNYPAYDHSGSDADNPVQTGYSEELQNGLRDSATQEENSNSGTFKQSVLGYDLPGFKIGDQDGLPGRNNLIGWIYFWLDNIYQITNDSNQPDRWVENPYVSFVNLASGYTPYDPNASGATPINQNGYYDDLSSLFNVGTYTAPTQDDPTPADQDNISFPLYGVVAQGVPYYDADNNFVGNTTKLFILSSALTFNQVRDFYNFVFNRAPNNTGEFSGKHYWDNTPDN